MHLYLAVRGILNQINRWEQDWNADYRQFFNDKNEFLGMLQTSMRPIRLYEMVFPEPQLMPILRKLQPSESWNPAYKKYINMIRIGMRLDKMPPLSSIPQRITTDAHCFNDVNIVGIGLKKDRYENGKELI